MSESTTTNIDRYFDGSASKGTTTELAEAIANDPQVALEFVLASRMNAALEAHFSESDARSEARVEIASALAVQAKTSARAESRAARVATVRSVLAPFSTAFRRPAAALAVAAAIAVACLLLIRPAGDEPLATAAPTPTTPATGPHSPAPSSIEPIERLISSQQVRRKFAAFHLPGLNISSLPIEDALAQVVTAIDDIADRHHDAEIRRIAIRLGKELGAGDARRLEAVSLHSGSIALADAVQLLAGQAGLRIAYIDGSVELRPRPLSGAPLRQRRYEVPADFLDLVADMIGGESPAMNPLASVGYQPPASASAALQPTGDGSLHSLAVRATPDDLRSIATLTSMMSPNLAPEVTVTTRVVHLPANSAAALVEASAAAGSGPVADVLAALSSIEPADRILNRDESRKLLQLVGNIEAAQVVGDSKSVIPIDAPTRHGAINTIDSHYQSVAENRLNGFVLQEWGLTRWDDLTDYTDLTLQLPGVTQADEGTRIRVEPQSGDIYVTSKFVEVEPQTGDIHTTSEFDEVQRGEIVRREFIYPTSYDPPETPSHFGTTQESTFTAVLEGESTRVSGSMVLAAAAKSHPSIDHDGDGMVEIAHWRLEADETAYRDEVLVDINDTDEVTIVTSVMPQEDEPIAVVDFDAVDREKAPIIVGFNLQEAEAAMNDFRYIAPSPVAPPQSGNVIDFDATLFPGQTLLLESIEEDGSKRLVLLTAEKR